MAGLSVQVGEVQQREEASALDRHAQLALVAGLGAGDARGNDLPVLVDEVLQDRDVLVVDFLDVLRGEAAELAPAEEPAILLAEELSAGKVAQAVTGGVSRAESVRLGMAEVPAEAVAVLWVVFHRVRRTYIPRRPSGRGPHVARALRQR